MSTTTPPTGHVSLVRALGETDPRVRAIRRVGRNGLTQTCLVTMLASGRAMSPCVQPEPGRCDDARRDAGSSARRGADLVVAARPSFAAGGRLRTRAGGPPGVPAAPVGRVDRPGERIFHDAPRGARKLTPRLSSLGYQVLLDLIATARGRLRIVELAGRSHDRRAARNSSSRSSCSRCWSRSSPATRCRSASCCSAWSA